MAKAPDRNFHPANFNLLNRHSGQPSSEIVWPSSEVNKWLPSLTLLAS